MWPTLLEIGDFHLASYGVLVAAGFLAGIWYLGRSPEHRAIGEDRFQGLVTGLFLSGMGGGKVLYLILHGAQLDWNPGAWLENLRFGFVYFGGFLGATAFGAWYVRKYRLDFWKLADPAAVGLALGHGIGRLGCFAAGCCYGSPTGLPWGTAFDHAEALVPAPLVGVPLHPAQLYDSFGNLALAAALHFIVLPRVRTGRLAKGSAFLGYLIGYSLIRFAVEIFRADDRGFFALGFSVSQWISLALLSVSCALVYRRLKDA